MNAWSCIDITRRNLTLITIGAWRVKASLDPLLTINHLRSLLTVLHFKRTTKFVHVQIYLTFLVIRVTWNLFCMNWCLITSSDTCIYNPLLLSSWCNQYFHAAIGRKRHLQGSFECIPGHQYTEQTGRYTTGHGRSSCYDLCTFSRHQGTLLM